MDRLSTLDASFLRIESSSAHMHVGWFSELVLPQGRRSLDPGLLTRSIGRRLHLAPRFRQIIADVPIGEPCWVDDPSFGLERHIDVIDGPGALSRREVERLADAFLSEQLDRGRPLWRILVIPRVEGSRAAIVGKVHHAMVDGIAAVELGMLLFDSSPEAELPPRRPWSPESFGGRMSLSVDAVADSAVEQFRAARRVAALGLAPRKTIRIAETMRRAALSIADDALNPAPPSFLNPKIGPQRTLVIERLPIERLDAIKRLAGTKLNDVVLAIVAGALRRLAAGNDEVATSLRVMVPISVRDDSESAAGGNRIIFAFVELPVDEPDPLRRLKLIRAQTLQLKDSDRVAGNDALLRSASALPGPLKVLAARLAASPRMYNLTVSNVPGPRTPLYAAGARVDTIYPVIPTSDGHALAIGALSYAGSLHFAVYADPEALPGVGNLAPLLSSALEELEAALSAAEASLRPRTPRRQRHSHPPVQIAPPEVMRR